MSTVKSILKGLFLAIFSLIYSVIIPLLFFRAIKDIPNIMGLSIVLENVLYNRIVFWIWAIGMITVAFSFAKGCSPKRSKRKALFGMGSVLANCFYIYSYKFSGAAEFTLIIQNFGFVSFDVGNLLILWMGLIFLKIVLDIYDFIDAILYHKREPKTEKNDLSEEIEEEVEQK